MNLDISVFKDLADLLFFAFMPLSMVYFSLQKIDQKLDEKIKAKKELRND